MLAFLKKYKDALFCAVLLLLLLFWVTSVRFVIPLGKSMEPTYCEGDRLLVIRYWGEPETGDAVMMKHGDGFWIKRIHAAAGDTADGEKIPEGFVYVLGDNLTASIDSRDPAVGLIPVDNIWGKVILDLTFRK